MDYLERKTHIIIITLIYIGMATPFSCFKPDSWICDYTFRNLYIGFEHLIIVCSMIFLRRFINIYRGIAV